MVKVKFFTLLREKSGVDSVEIEVDGTVSVGELLKGVESRVKSGLFEGIITKNGALLDRAVILINGRNIAHLKGMDTPVKDGDEVLLFPPGGGG